MKYAFRKTLIFFLSVVMISLFHSCKKPTAPTVTTASVTEITETTAKSGGNVTSDGGADVTVRGVCWGTENNPTTADTKSVNGSGTGGFVSELTGLTENTDYFVRAYAVNSEGTAYGDPVSFKTEQIKTVTDADGKVYDIVSINTQAWIAENLKTTKFSDGTDIPLISDNIEWTSATGAGYCWYGNDQAANGNTYGSLYNWYAVTDAKGLCPTGFHVATEADWEALITFAGGEAVAGGKLKEQGTVHWSSPNTDATDLYEFTALPGGRRNNDASFYYIGNYGRWWTSTVYDASNAWSYGMSYDNSNVDKDYRLKNYGLSVRCVKNN